MKNQPLVLSEWSSIVGADSVAFPDEGVRRVDVPVITQGATFVVELPDGSVCVGSGRGAMVLSFGVAGAFSLAVIPDKPTYITSFRVPWARDGMEPGWANSASFTDPNPKDGPQVSKEVQLMFEAMQRNMLAREAQLREEIARRR